MYWDSSGTMLGSLSSQRFAHMIHEGSSRKRRKHVPREAQQRVERISFKCFEFHVSGFKLFDSDW